MTTSKWVWWIFLLVAPLLAYLLLSAGSVALPVGLVVTAIPVFVTWRLLGNRWRTWPIVRILYVLLTASTIVLVFADPGMPTSMYVPVWLASGLGFYFIAAPLLLSGCVLYELHRVSIET